MRKLIRPTHRLGCVTNPVDRIGNSAKRLGAQKIVQNVARDPAWESAEQDHHNGPAPSTRHNHVDADL